LAAKKVRSTNRNAAPPARTCHSGRCQRIRTTTKKRIVSIASVPVTAIPYAEASAVELPKPTTRATTAKKMPQLTAGT